MTVRRTAKKAPARRLPILDSSTSKAPRDPAEFAKLVKIIRDRRWRASKREDWELVDEMQARLDRSYVTSER